MRAALFACLLAAFAPSCVGVRAPAPIDVRALLASRGPEEAHRDLTIRVLDDKRFEVFDLTADKDEKKNLVDRDKELSGQLQQQLTDWMDGL